MEHVSELLSRLGVDLASHVGKDLEVHSPIDGSLLATLRKQGSAEGDEAITRASHAFREWRDVPAPRRGELVRLFGEELRAHKEELGRLVTLECGKVLEEGRGEVQEMIDICDFAVGLSRQLYGLTIASERPEHTMQENWMPLGPIGVISAFNFPVAVWSWNCALAFVCGDPVVWKPSHKTPLTALACQALFDRACTRYGSAPDGLSTVVIGDRSVGDLLVTDPRIPLISATGSTKMGKAIAPKIAERFARAILELGGNNAVVVTPRADLDVAIPSILFGAVGTAGQRCTSTRRVIVHRSIADSVFQRLKGALSGVASRIGDPMDPRTLVGPLIDKGAYDDLEAAIQQARPDAQELVGGERVHAERWPDAYYVRPALSFMPNQTAIVEQETFAPLLYVIPYDTLEHALEIHNAVPQGLSSSIMTTDVREAEYFKRNSDCGIANVNIGTSGAEIGGAFGGEKETGGGRESGSDVWKLYMRRQTSTTYYGTEKPALAQGIVFE